MKHFDIHGSTICYDDWNLDGKPELQDFIDGDEIKKIIESIPEDIIVALGGDGTMLDVIQAYHDEQRPFLGINFGSKGFLLNHRDWIKNSSGFVSMDYPLLEVKQNGELSGFCFNDVCIYSPEKKVISLNVSQKNVGSIDLKGDGTLISTPAGSTGHSESYGARPMPHDTDKLIITPLGDKTHRKSKVMHQSDDEIVIKNTGRKPRINVNLDGKETISISENEDITLQIKRIPNKVRLLISKDHKQDWDNRVMEEQGFN